VITESRHTLTVQSLLAKEAVGEAEFSCSLVLVSATIAGVDFVAASGLWALCAVIPEPCPGWSQEPADRSEQVSQGVKELGLDSDVSQDGQRQEDQNGNLAVNTHSVFLYFIDNPEITNF